MEKQTKEKAIKEAVKKCPYKKECGKEQLTKEEIEIIINELEVNFSSALEYDSKEKKGEFSIKNCEKFESDDFSLKDVGYKQSEFDTLMGLLKKLKKLKKEVRNSSHA